MNVKHLLDLSGKISVRHRRHRILRQAHFRGSGRGRSPRRHRLQKPAALPGLGIKVGGEGPLRQRRRIRPGKRVVHPRLLRAGLEAVRRHRRSGQQLGGAAHESLRGPPTGLGAIHGDQCHRRLRHLPGFRGPDDGAGKGSSCQHRFHPVRSGPQLHQLRRHRHDHAPRLPLFTSMG